MILENVQAGDTLIWHGRYGRDRRLVTVKRTTKTQVVIFDGKFRKSDGQHVGRTRWGSLNVTIPEPGEIEEVRNQLLHCHLVGRVDDACLSND